MAIKKASKAKKGEDSDDGQMSRRASVQNSFLWSYAEGDLLIFEEMIEKMISSKNYEIYNQAKLRKNDPNAPAESSSSEESKEDSESSSSDSEDNVGLRPSGIIFQLHVDPNASDDDDAALFANARDSMKKKQDVEEDSEEERIRLE